LTHFVFNFIFLRVKKHPAKYDFKVPGRSSDELIDAIRGIQRGLDSMAAGQGEPARKVLDRIRAKHKIPKISR